MSNRSYHRHTLSLSALTLLAACSGDVVDLGENASELTSDTPCGGDATVSGSVFVQNQEELDRLAGCQTIEGDLVVYPFEAPDFRALGALRVVEGELELGRLRLADAELTGASDREDLLSDVGLQNAGWISSLAGFEALQSVGALQLRGVGTNNLLPLSRLRTLTQGGLLEIGPCVNLRSLAGLENVTGLVNVLLHCDSLESLAGLELPSSMGQLSISGASISDLGGFAVTGANALSITRTGLRNLDALSSLGGVQQLAIQNNPVLIDAEGLSGIGLLNELVVSNNAVLERLPDFASVSLLVTLDVRANPALVALPSFPGLLPASERELLLGSLPPTRVNLDADAIVVRDNAALTEVSLPRGLPSVRYVEIADNPALGRIDLSDVRSLDFLLIGDNPALATVDVGGLDTVDDLRVLGNPALSLDAFDGVRTFFSQLSSEPTPDEPSP